MGHSKARTNGPLKYALKKCVSKNLYSVERYRAPKQSQSKQAERVRQRDLFRNNNEALSLSDETI